MRSSLVAFTCLVRGLRLFFGAAPRTTLRALGVIALDMLHVLRYSQPLPARRAAELATFLDFQGCVNAAWDHKPFCPVDSQALRDRLEDSGLGPCVGRYVAMLRELESRRPSVGGDHRSFDAARSYREAVAFLAISTAAGLALDNVPRGPDTDLARTDPNVNTLFRILMQCQIIDDLLDYSADRAAGLPTFLTSSASLPQAMDWTEEASRSYSARPCGSSANAVFPLRVALAAFTAATRLLLRAARPLRLTHISRLAH